MSADFIQAQYEQLETIANRFAQEAENNGALAQRVTQSVQALQNGGWEGKGATAFNEVFKEDYMESMIGSHFEG